MKKILIATAVAATVGMSSQAMGGAIAYSYLELSNVSLFNVTANRQADVSDFVNLNIGASSEASATSSFGPNAVNANPLGHDTLLACSGIAGCAGIAENDPTQQLGNTNFGRSDTFGDGGFLITGLGGQNSANVWTVSEGRQSDTGNTTGQSTAQSSTQFGFELTDDITLRLDFDATGRLIAELHQDDVQAIAGFNWNASIVDRDTNLTVFSWTPDGQAGGITGGVELFDAFDMSDGRSVLEAGLSDTGDLSGFFSASTTLSAGRYQFTIIHQSSHNTVAVKPVPEPATLALLAAGLGMLGFSRRSKQA